MSTVALHSTLNISETVLEIEAWSQRTTNRKWHMDYQMVMWLMTSHWRISGDQWSWSHILASDWWYVLLCIAVPSVRPQPLTRVGPVHTYHRAVLSKWRSGLWEVADYCCSWKTCWRRQMLARVTMSTQFCWKTVATWWSLCACMSNREKGGKV